MGRTSRDKPGSMSPSLCPNFLPPFWSCLSSVWSIFPARLGVKGKSHCCVLSFHPLGFAAAAGGGKTSQLEPLGWGIAGSDGQLGGSRTRSNSQLEFPCDPPHTCGHTQQSWLHPPVWPHRHHSSPWLRAVTFPLCLFKYTQIPHFPALLQAFSRSHIQFPLFSRDLAINPALISHHHQSPDSNLYQP